MKSRLALLALLVGFGPTPALSQQVPFVPTPHEVADAMLQVAEVGSNDFVVDLGSGDGRIVITAAQKYGARGFGVDLNGDLVAKSNRAAREAGVADRAKFYQQDLFEADISPATVVTMYLLPQVNLDLRSKLLSELRPGTRLVSHAFDMGEWQPAWKGAINLEGRSREIFLWIIPARAQGVWDLQVGPRNAVQNYKLTVRQDIQEIQGTITGSGRTKPIGNAQLQGERIQFTMVANVNGREVSGRFEGRVNGNVMEGTMITGDGAKQPVRATKVS